MVTINMIGKPCPIPVVEAKKALSQPGTQGVVVLVDNIIAVQNLEKMAAGSGYGFSSERKSETEYAARIFVKDPNGKALDVSRPEQAVSSGRVTFLITGDQIGISEGEPGRKLMKSFLYSLAQLPAAPETVLLVNAGVKLAADGSEALEDLKTLAALGANILACGQCLGYYGLTDKLAVGKVTTMLEIVEILSSALRTVTL